MGAQRPPAMKNSTLRRRCGTLADSTNRVMMRLTGKTHFKKNQRHSNVQKVWEAFLMFKKYLEYNEEIESLTRKVYNKVLVHMKTHFRHYVHVNPEKIKALETIYEVARKLITAEEESQTRLLESLDQWADYFIGYDTLFDNENSNADETDPDETDTDNECSAIEEAE